jgi:hypothetical protein
VSLDALYTNEENAHIIVQEKGGDYLLSVKDNQPALVRTLERELSDTPFFE